MSKHLLRVENVYKRFGDNEVLKGISFQLDKGETKVIVGPSGTGKSTILSLINMLVTPDEGHIYLEDIDITRTRDIHKVRQNISFVFQDFGLFNHLTAKGNVMIGLTKVKKMKKKRRKRLPWKS